MEIKKEKLLASAQNIGISSSQAEKLWNTLEEDAPSSTSQLSIIHIAYYLGALIAISAMAWFIGIGWEILGGAGIFFVALVYASLFIFIGNKLWKKKLFKIPAGLFITMAVCLTPLAIYGLERMFGLWPEEDPGYYANFYAWVKGGWFFMELATIFTALTALYFYRFPFLTMPLFFVLWYMSMDITPLLFGPDYTFQNSVEVSLVFGIMILIISYFIDQRSQEDFAFWGYFFGVLCFWCGLTLFQTESEWENAFYCLINIFLVFLSILLQRKVFLIFGALGVFIYISSLFTRYFFDSLAFPFILTGLGILIIYLGILYQKHGLKLEQKVFNSLPYWLIKILPKKNS